MEVEETIIQSENDHGSEKCLNIQQSGQLIDKLNGELVCS